MDPNTPQNNLVPAQSLAPASSKKAKVTIICLAVLSIFLAIGTAVFAYLYFSEKSSNESVSTVQEDYEFDDGDDYDSDEVEITDTYTLRDLDSKIAILFRTTDATSLIAKRGGMYFADIDLLRDGSLPLKSEVAHVIDSLKNRFSYLGEEKIRAAASQSGFDESALNYFRTAHSDGIDADIVAEKYEDVFGKELVREPLEGKYHCMFYQYNPDYDFYYDDNLGCGGTSPYSRYYYKYKYTTFGEKAYVYFAAALFNGETSQVHCDVALGAEDNQYGISTPVCATLDSSDGSTLDDVEVINENNYQEYAQYRFVFNEADDGTYYFDKVEKL